MLNFEQSLEIINAEYDADDGLFLLFRLSADIEPQRLETFIQALNTIDAYYENKAMIEKRLVYKLLSFYTTLNASARHWKVSRPKSLTRKAVYNVNRAILDIFASD